MLSSIKDKTKGWVAYLIIGLIVIPFALFGVSEYFTGTTSVVVASVGDDDISKEAYLKEFNDTKRRLQQELGEKYTAELNRRVKYSTIQSMINRRVLEQLANEMSYATTQHELQKFIQSNDMFKDEGKFSVKRYKQLLRLSGFSDVEYERVQTEELTQNQIKHNFLNSAFVTPSALNRMQLLNDQQRKFSYIVLDAKNHINEVDADPKDVQKFYDSRKQMFFEPQKVKVDFVELSTQKIATNIKVNEDDLFNFYEDEKARFSTEEERNAQHILVESKALADTIVSQLKQGDSFDELAAKHSQDTGSKDTGGDLGFFTKGVMVPEFEAKVFSMKTGELSTPVKTNFGYHIIKLNEIQAGGAKPFNEVRDEVAKLYTEYSAQKTIYALTDQLSKLAYEESLEEIAEKMDLKLETSDFLMQNTKKYDAKFIAAAYNDAVLNKGENSEVIELAKDKFVVLRINNKIAQRQKTFDEVKSGINQHLNALLAKTFIEITAKKITTAFNENDAQTAKKLMDKYQLKWQDMGWVQRNSKKINVNIVNAVFALPKPSDTVVTYGLQSLNEQQTAVLKLLAIKTPKSTPSDNDALSDTLLHLESEEMFRSILATLHKNTEIEIFADRL